MITIIKQGTKQQATCHECGCLFSFDESDTKYKNRYPTNYAGTGSANGYQPMIHYVECPQCKNHVQLNVVPKGPLQA